MTEAELAAEIESMRDDEEAWGDSVQGPKPKPKSERRQRGAMVSVRFSASELEEVQAHAVEAGTSVSGYLRNLALATAQQPVVTMTWAGTATQNLPATQERILVRSSPSQFPWLPGTSLVIDR